MFYCLLNNTPSILTECCFCARWQCKTMCIIRLARFIASSSVGESSMDSVGFSLLAAQVAITLTSSFPDSGKGEGRNGPKIAFCRRASQPSSQTRRSSELRACRYWAVITRHKYKTLWLSLFFFFSGASCQVGHRDISWESSPCR